MSNTATFDVVQQQVKQQQNAARCMRAVKARREEPVMRSQPPDINVGRLAMRRAAHQQPAQRPRLPGTHSGATRAHTFQHAPAARRQPAMAAARLCDPRPPRAAVPAHRHAARRLPAPLPPRRRSCC